MSIFFFFFKNRTGRQTGPDCGVATSRRGGLKVRAAEYAGICWQHSVYIFLNGKMRPVETIPGGGQRRMMEG
jgi:hypothetical protein